MMCNKYFVAVTSEPHDGAYIVRFLDNPIIELRVKNHGDIYREAELKIQSMYSNKILENPANVNEGHALIKRLATNGQAAYLLAITIMPKDELKDYKLVRINLSIKDDVLRDVDKAARRARMTRSSYMMHAAIERMQRERVG